MICLIILGIVPVSIAVAVLVQNSETIAVKNYAAELRRQGSTVCNLLIEEDYLKDSSSPAANGKLELLANSCGGRVILVDRDFKVVKDTYGAEEGRILVSSEVVECFKDPRYDGYETDGDYISVTLPLGGTDTLQGVMLITGSTDCLVLNRVELARRGLAFIGLAFLVCIIAGFILSKLLVKPLNKVSQSIVNLTDGYEEELPSSDYIEVFQITDAFNKMLARMKVQDESRQEFVSNVSHELKTPMTSMKVLADSLLGQRGIDESLYQEFLADISSEIDRENKIIGDLLTLVRMDKKVAAPDIRRTNINNLLEAILRRLRPIAEQRNISLILDSYRTVEADVDEVKFTLAISNLVENGIKYNVDEGWVRVSIDADHLFFYVTVADSGLGIPEEALGRIFERFYRADKSHSKEISGTGLGLSIARSSIGMMKGVITVASTEGEGSTFTVKIPVIYSAEQIREETAEAQAEARSEAGTEAKAEVRPEAKLGAGTEAESEEKVGPVKDAEAEAAAEYFPAFAADYDDYDELIEEEHEETDE